MIDAASSYGLSATNDAAQNSEALVNAINSANGQTVIIPQGTYALQPLTIYADGTTLQLAPGAVLVASYPRVPAILNIRANHVTIDGGQFDGASIAGAAGIMAIRISGTCSHIAIRNCTVRNASVGIGSYSAIGGGDWEISDCTIDTTVKGHGICLHGHPTDNEAIRNVRVLNNTIRNTTGNGIWIGNRFEDVIVTGNQISDSGRMGIEVWRNPTGGFVIGDNIVDVAAWMGISIADTPDTLCHRNIVRHASGYGIEVANSRNVSLVGNRIETVLPRDGGAKPCGIVLNSPTNGAVGDIAINGGIISDCYCGINVCGDKGKRDTIAITGVIIRGCVVGIHNVGMIGGRDGGGVVEHVSITGCVIRTNSVGIGNSLYGGVMRSGVISGNDVWAGDGDGISLFRPTDMLVSSNRVAGTNAIGSIGILLRDNPSTPPTQHNLLVTDNLITGFATAVEVKRIYESNIQG